MITVPLAAYEDDDGNRILYDGPRNENVTITFRGGNNVVRAHAKANATKLDVDFNSSNGTFILGANPHKRSFSAGVRVGEDATVQIGDGVSSTAGVTISAVEGVSVIIGNDVMFASQNQVRADDGHPIFDVRSGKRVNTARSIRIGDHVWLAFGAIVLAGAWIGEGSVIGAGSIVTRRVPNNVVAVGSPAVVVRRHVAWERPHLGLVPPYYKPDASTVKKSKYWSLTVDHGVPIKRTVVGRVVRRVRRIARTVRSPRAFR
jgi:acetyltransferase-like isoleucine patch superfamily enzyme